MTLVKKTFFIRIKNEKITMSFDGEQFYNLKDLIRGQLTIGASSMFENQENNIPIKAIQILLEAYLR